MGKASKSGIAALLATALTLTVVLAPGGAASSRPCGKAGQPPLKVTKHQMRTSMLCLINRARKRRGIPRLKFHPALKRAATGHSRFMVRFSSFSHVGRGGSTFTSRIGRSGYLRRVSSYRLAENIGAGNGTFGSPRGVFKLWLHSPPHRRNMFDRRLREFGVGVARGNPFGGPSKNAATYTLDIGVRRR
jgi:uncharacterized protein YkwD